MTTSQNRAADVSVWSLLAGLSLWLGYLPLYRTMSTFRVIDPFILVPLCGITAATSGAIGLTKTRDGGSGKLRSVVGLLGGLAICAVTAAALLFIWSWSHSKGSF
jgi:hypothetical protein